MSGRLIVDPGFERTRLPEPKKNSILVTDNNAVGKWVTLDATSLPYTSPASGRLDNVSTALDTLLSQYRNVLVELGNVLDIAKRLDAENDAVIVQVQNHIAAMSVDLAQVSDTVRRNSHRPLALSKITNPALAFEPHSQTIRLDLTVPGSFEDSVAKWGTDSVQGAFNKIALMIGSLQIDVNKLNVAMSALNERMSVIENKVNAVEKKVLDNK